MRSSLSRGEGSRDEVSLARAARNGARCKRESECSKLNRLEQGLNLPLDIFGIAVRLPRSRDYRHKALRLEYNVRISIIIILDWNTVIYSIFSSSYKQVLQASRAQNKARWMDVACKNNSQNSSLLITLVKAFALKISAQRSAAPGGGGSGRILLL